MDIAQQNRPRSMRRIFIRCFVALFLLAIAIDTFPKCDWVFPIQKRVGPVLNYTGLWQGDWPLFAPNPVINNGWVSAEFYRDDSSTPLQSADGKPLSWSSPVWSECTSWDKFYRFRHVNYFNRIPIRSQNMINDLADYVAREKLGPDYRLVEPVSSDSPSTTLQAKEAIELRLTKNALRIVLPDDGTLPPPDETTWIYVGSSLATRKYSP